MRYPAYPRYKPSGVEWLGDMPSAWDLRRLKHVATIRYGLGEPPEYTDDGLLFVRATDIKQGKIVSESILRVDPSDIPWSRSPLLEENEILVVRSGAYTGDSAIVAHEIAGSIAGFDMVITVENANPRFIAWVLLSKYLLEGQIHITRMRAAQPHLNAEELGGFNIILPPINEQNAIADFLNAQTAKIDTLLAKKRELIEKLKEKRAVLISQTVTRGLPPEVASAVSLNPHPRLKPSGAEWLGDIPEHWNVKRLKHLLKMPLKYGANETTDLFDTDLPRFVRITDIDEMGHLREETFRSLSYDVAYPYILQESDLLFARSGATSGKTFLYNINWGICAFAGYLILARLKIEVNPKFIRYFTDSSNYWQWVSSIYIQSTIQNISAEKYAGLLIALPDYNEQTLIVDFLDKETSTIDNMILRVEEAIRRLQEYRAALITAAVTGKIDVREVTA